MTTGCDFCAAMPPAAWDYPADDFLVAIVGEHAEVWSRGPWAACPGCHELLQAGRWDDLAARAAGPPAIVGPLWAGFRAHRRGPAVPRPTTRRGGWGR
jgi:hypothetical protein